MTDSDHTRLLRALLMAVVDLDELPHPRPLNLQWTKPNPKAIAIVRQKDNSDRLHGFSDGGVHVARHWLG